MGGSASTVLTTWPPTGTHLVLPVRSATVLRLCPRSERVTPTPAVPPLTAYKLMWKAVLLLSSHYPTSP